jgi:hypothetical protein
MSAVAVIPMEVRFESEDLSDDELLDRCELLLDFDDLLRLDQLRRQARNQGDDIVVREALAGDGVTERRMLVFGYAAGDRTVWKGTLTAFAREVAS